MKKRLNFGLFVLLGAVVWGLAEDKNLSAQGGDSSEIVFSDNMGEDSNGVWERYEFSEERMAVPVRLVFYAPSEEKAEAAKEAVYARFDELNRILSDYNPESEVIQACRKSEENLQPIEISNDLFAVLRAARYYNQLTGGAFDVTVSPIVKLWRRSRSVHRFPPAQYLKEAKELVGNNRWELSESPSSDLLSHGVMGQMNGPQTVRILKKNVRFDLGGIAKGYAIDEGFRVLRRFGIRSALIDAGGDIRVGDAPPDKEGWTIGIASLDEKAAAAFYINAVNAAIATSGDTFQFVELKDVRYSHIIDPRTGDPLTRHCVVSVLAPSAMEADALASGISVLGPEEGVILADSLPHVETIIFRSDFEPSPPKDNWGEERKEDGELEVGNQENDAEEAEEMAPVPEIFATGRFIEIKKSLMPEEDPDEE